MLTFSEEALEKIAEEAIKIKSGARGLRAIMEDVLLNPMYDVPTYKDIIEVIIDEKVIIEGSPPQYIYYDDDELWREMIEGE